DPVPKTGEGNTFLYILLGMVLCAGVAAIYMFKAMRSQAAAGNGGSTTEAIVPEKKEEDGNEKDSWDDID
ncbi:MAG: LPXTG cell wall anchor domain-containing protein, partial [Lachnospiraceae bacterium]|nr:LPXTG cell wall anchor domain-containing protein [Lachnospiraceae bacterium]